MSKDNSGPAFSLEAQELNEKIDRLQNEVSSPKKQLRGARTMTEIPGGFQKKVCPETFVSNHTGPIRLAEDQMQRLLRCIVMGRIVRDIEEEEPKPDPAPGQVKVSGGGWVDPEPAPGHVSAQIWSDLWRDYNEGKEELLKAKQEIERCTEERDIARDHAFDLFNQLNKTEQENERLKAQIADYQKQHEMTMGVGDGDGNLFVHGSQEAIHRVREYLSAIEQLVKEKHELKAQVPKERACVILGPYGENYELFMAPIIFGDRESATKWAEERGLEVVE